MENRVSKLGEVLLDKGLIRQKQLAEALEIQKQDKRRLGELLVEKGWLDHRQLAEILSQIFSIAYVRLSDIKVDENVLALIPKDLMFTYKIFPLSASGNYLTIATHDPLDFASLQDLQYKSGYSIIPLMTSRQDIEEHLKKYADLIAAVHASKDIQENAANAAPVVQLVDKIINEAIRDKASDIHFEPQRDKMRVRIRIDGMLYERMPIPKGLERKVMSRIKILAGMDVAETRRPQDGRLSLVKDNAEYDVRVSTLPDVLGENLVLRILSKKFFNRSFESLGLDARDVSLIHELMARPYGLILVTGPTGAGKTTTLYSMLNHLNQISRNIITVEDPVEYELPGINQTAINPFIGYSFATAIRHILRHDPDIIMVGEIRDLETAEIAVRAALTGHLVLSTMHTNTAAGAIIRLLEMDIEPFLIASALNGIIAQRLIRKICPACAREQVASREITRQIQKELPAQKTFPFAEATGCPECLMTGYRGRTGVFEILKVNETIRELILKSATEKDIVRAALKNGMKTLRRAGIDKAAAKVTPIREVLRIVSLD